LKNSWHRRPEIEPAILDLSSQSGAYDHSVTSTRGTFPKYRPPDAVLAQAGKRQ